MKDQPGRAVPTFVHLCFTLSDKTMDSDLHWGKKKDSEFI